MRKGSNVILNKTYIEDIAGSSRNREATDETIHEIDQILTSGSFRVKNWHSNDPSLDSFDKKTTTILGVTWCKEENI